MISYPQSRRLDNGALGVEQLSEGWHLSRRRTQREDELFTEFFPSSEWTPDERQQLLMRQETLIAKGIITVDPGTHDACRDALLGAPSCMLEEIRQEILQACGIALPLVS